MNNYPFMQQKDIDMLNAYFIKYQPRIVVEWGAGGSTIYFPAKHKCIQQWYTFEHEITWVNKIMNLNFKRDLPIYCYYSPKKYVENITAIEVLSYTDFVLIDGIYRKECLEVCANLVKPGTLIFLHDSGRNQYQNWLNCFEHRKQLTEGRVPDGQGGYKRDGLHLFWQEV